MLANYIMKINVLLYKNNELRLFELNLINISREFNLLMTRGRETIARRKA